MDLISQVTMLGGVADRATLVGLRSRAEVDQALRDGVLVRDARGRYALASARQAMRTANAVAGVLSHRSAARYWGWAQKHPDTLAEVTVPRSRKVDRSLRAVLIPHWSDLPDSDVQGGVTTQRRTLVDCMRNLPFDEALAIVDSALRADDVTHEELQAIAEATRGRGRQRIRDVAAAADSRAANPFESVLRAQALLVPGLSVRPQEPVHVAGRRRPIHPDLGDAELLIAVEAEGFEFHGDRVALARDCKRYNALANSGWLVIRFSWTQVMYEPAYVQRVLREAVAIARARRAGVAAAGRANVA